MSLFNTQNHWGWVTIFIHWLTAITVIALFILGLWMVELTYYDSWYRDAPNIHKSIGLLLFAITLFRILWLSLSIRPGALSSYSQIEQQLAKIVHWALYILLFSLMFSGYLISTADGRAIELFNWFDVPAIISGIEGQEDIAGQVHYILAMSLIVITGIHAMGAIKHHFIDKDSTLTRMLGHF
ncbi:MAG: cytochrome b [Pseudomonadota bacterium]